MTPSLILEYDCGRRVRLARLESILNTEERQEDHAELCPDCPSSKKGGAA